MDRSAPSASSCKYRLLGFPIRAIRVIRGKRVWGLLAGFRFQASGFRFCSVASVNSVLNDPVPRHSLHRAHREHRGTIRLI